MATVMTKRGTQDNVATYEHVCDTTADMAAINPQYINLGSICLVINGESGGLEVYIADSNKQWSAISAVAGGGSGGLSIHICSANEYDSITKTPTITTPAADTIYLVPTGSATGDLFSEWIYVDSAWERIGGTSIDLSQYATKTDLTNYVAKSDYDPTDRYIELYYNANTNSYTWTSDAAQHFSWLSDICQTAIDFNKKPSTYAVLAEEEEYDTTGLHNHGRIYPLIYAHTKQGENADTGNPTHENLAIFGATYVNDNGQLVFESFTITNHAVPYATQDDVITHSITPIGSADLSQYATKAELAAVEPPLYIKFDYINVGGRYVWNTSESNVSNMKELYEAVAQNHKFVYARIDSSAWPNTGYFILPISFVREINNNSYEAYFRGIESFDTSAPSYYLRTFSVSGVATANTTTTTNLFEFQPLEKSKEDKPVFFTLNDQTQQYVWTEVGYGYFEDAEQLAHEILDGYKANINVFVLTEDTTRALTDSASIFPALSAKDIMEYDENADEYEQRHYEINFGGTHLDSNGQMVFERFTLITPPNDFGFYNCSVEHSVTPIASSAGSFTAAEELSDVATNLKSLVQEIAYTTSSSHAAATITSIDTLLTVLDTMKPQPTYTANVIYENFTNNATRFSTDNIPINFANGDYVEALIDVTTCSQDQENILSVGTSIDGFDAAVAYLFYWRNNQIHVRLKDVEASIAVDRYVAPADTSAVLIRIDSTGAYVDGDLVKDITGDNVTHLNSASTYKIGCRMSKLNTATYDHITVYNKN